MNKAACVRRYVQEEKGVTSDTLVVYLKKVLKGFDVVILVLLPEPARTDGNIALRCDPAVASFDSFIQCLEGYRRSGKVIIYIHRAPACTSGVSSFIADPAASGAVVAEDDGVRLHLIYGGIEQRPVIYLLLAVRSFAAGTVEPLLEYRTVVS